MDPRQNKYMESMAVMQLDAATRYVDHLPPSISDLMRPVLTFRGFNNIVEVAFKRCVHSFRSNKMSEKEKKCVKDVAETWMQFNQRVSMRFAEEQGKMQAKQAAAAAAKGAVA